MLQDDAVSRSLRAECRRFFARACDSGHSLLRGLCLTANASSYALAPEIVKQIVLSLAAGLPPFGRRPGFHAPGFLFDSSDRG